jgi:uncharacterized protein involved in outer membrane biogenesis
MRRVPWLPLLVIALLVGAYALAGLVWAPRWAAGAFRDFVTRELKLEPSLASLKINPFTLTVEARGLAIRERGGAPLVAVDRLYVNASIASLWRLEPVLDEVTIDHPVIQAQLRADGSINLAALAPPADPKAPPATPGEPLPALRLRQLQVHGGELGIDDLGEQPVLHAHFAPIELRVQDFTTRGKGSDLFEVQAVGPAGAKFSLDGHVVPQPFAVDGRFGIEQMKAVALSGYAHDFLPFDMTGGLLRLATRYRLASGTAGLGVEVDIDALEGQALELQARSASAPDVHLAAFKVAGANFSLARRQFSLGTVTLDGLELNAVLGPKGLNLLRLLDSGEPAPAATPAPVPPVAGTGRVAAAPWLLLLPQLRVSDARVHLLDNTAPAPAPLELSALGLELRDYSSKPATKMPLTVAAKIGETGHFEAQLTVQPDAPSAEGKVKLAGFDLRAIQPYLTPFVRLDLRGGEAAFEGQLHVAPGATATAPLRVAYEGTFGVQGLQSADRLQHKDFVRWQSLQLAGIRYRSEPASLTIRQIDFDQPFVDLVIAQDGTTNISDVLTASSAASGGPAATATAPAPVPKPAAKPAKGAKGKPAPKKPAPPTKLPIQLAIDTVNIKAGSANFEDYSIKPNFGTGIQTLGGTITGLSSQPDSRAVLQLDGAVDKYAPMHMSGELNVLSAQSYLDLKASFRNMELTALTPYSGKFAGYEIQRGKLSIDVTYKVRNRQLEAQHKILLTQLQLGDKVDSPDATSLPLKLVVALLKDRDGNIDLDLPVTGDLDDPKFRVGPIIWKMIVNLATRIVTSPFALLGKMFGGGEDMQFIDFAPGDVSLDAPMQERLGAITKALRDRPGLSLEIPLAGDPALDAGALRATVWTAQQEAIAPAAVRADRAAYLQKLEKAWPASGGKPIPEPAAPATAGAAVAGAPPADPEAQRRAQREARIGSLERAFQERIVFDDNVVDALAQARAHIIQDAILGAGDIDPLRVFIVAPAKDVAKDGRVRVTLAITS